MWRMCCAWDRKGGSVRALTISASGRSWSFFFCCTISRISSTGSGGSAVMASVRLFFSSSICTSVTFFLL